MATVFTWSVSKRDQPESFGWGTIGPVRRFTPWFFLLATIVAAAAGAALGVAQRSSALTPSQWVTGALASTDKAGSADFSYSCITSSLNPELRGSISGHGLVDFSDGDVRVTEIDHDISFSATGNEALRPVSSTSTLEAIVVGRTVYQANPIPGIPLAGRYHVLPFPGLPRSQRGLSLALNASVALDTLSGPYAVASVTKLGTAEVDGVATTKYEVGYALLHVCAPHESPQVLSQRPTGVWLDGAGRVVRVRSTFYSNDRRPHGVKIPAAFDDFPQGAVTTVATLTFSEFGAPVHVTAPPASAIIEGGSTSFGTATAKIDACPS